MARDIPTYIGIVNESCVPRSCVADSLDSLYANSETLSSFKLLYHRGLFKAMEY
jgi:hypothetical protein